MHYGIDFRDAVYGTEMRTPSSHIGWIGVRRLRALIDGLPTDGAFARSFNPEGVQFNNAVAQFLAIGLEQMDSHRMDYVQRNSDPKTFKRPEALHIKRPWEAPEPVKTGDDLFVFIRRIGAGG
jgi:hypothetical protein